MFPNLRAEMARKNITNEMLAKYLGINPATMSKKLNNIDLLKFNEAIKIRDKFFPGLATDVLFATDSQKAG